MLIADPVIAVIDDHVLLAQMITHALRADNLNAHVVDIDQPLVEQVAALGAAAVVLDLQLGDDRPLGTKLIEPLQALGVRVLMLTGVDNDVEIAKCLAAGADGVIQKVESLERVVEQVHLSLDNLGALLPGRADRSAYNQLLTSHRLDQATAQACFATLTNREQAVLAGLMRGLSAGAIADEHFVSIETVRSQVKSLLRKLEVHTQLEAVAMAHDASWQPAEGLPSPD